MSYDYVGCLSESSQMCVGEGLMDGKIKEFLHERKYFHKLVENENESDCESDGELDYDYYLHTRCYEYDGEIFEINNDTITYKMPVFKAKVFMNIYHCDLCDDDDITYKFKLNEPTNLGYCPYYENAAVKIQRRFRLRNQMRVLWRIAEYYMKRKYAPENILKYIELK